MKNNIEHKFSSAELESIFNKNIDRSIFISSYPHFGDDGNEYFYINFIDSNIFRNKFKAQEDALELSIKIKIFKKEYLSVVRQIIYSRRSAWMKLLALDWLFNFYSDIPRDVFFEINNYTAKSGQDILVQVQSLLNLLLIEECNGKIYDLLITLSCSKDAAAFYRVLYGLKRTYLSDEKINGSILSIINDNDYLSKSQKDELRNLTRCAV